MMQNPQMMMQMMGKGGPQQQGQPMQQQQQQQQQPGPSGLTAAALAAAPPAVQKQMLGEKLFATISKLQPALAGKITGMMLEMDSSELLILLESPQQLQTKVNEAMIVLK